MRNPQTKNSQAQIAQAKCTRQAIRKRLRKKRNSLSPTQQKRAAYQVFQRLTRLPELRRAKSIASYLATDGEINLDAAMNWLWNNNRQVFLPKIKKEFGMHFSRYQKRSQLRANRYGIDEAASSQELSASQFDIIFVPLVAFGKNGERLGMGGGYYDRALASLAARRPLLIGVAHSCQFVEKLDSRAWDINMDIIVTDKQLLRCPRFYQM